MCVVVGLTDVVVELLGTKFEFCKDFFLCTLMHFLSFFRSLAGVFGPHIVHCHGVDGNLVTHHSGGLRCWFSGGMAHYPSPKGQE